MKRGKLILWSIVIPLICITLFFSCKKTDEVQTSDLSLEPTEELLETTEPPKGNFGVIIKPRTPRLPYDDTIIYESLNLFFKYDYKLEDIRI